MADSGDLERIARLRARVDEAAEGWRAKRALAGALRELLEHLPLTAADDAEVEALVPVIQEATRRFAAAGRVPGARDSNALFTGMEHFLDVGPIAGLSNPVAPPFAFEVDAEAGVVRGRGRFGKAYEGAPGLLHGGYLAAAVDELLGLATVLSGGPGMTRELTIRYLRATPIGAEIVITGRLDRVEGRRLFVSADVEADGVRTASASGLFTAVGDAHFASFAAARERREGS